ncbi:MAG: hypothetical protein Q8O82_20425, partial [Pseudorhodobacter sp.]|nr:hypothetical protein [Pseudorhodobacter sp.]
MPLPASNAQVADADGGMPRLLGIIPTALLSDRFGVIAVCDGSDGIDVVSEEVPGITASVDDLCVGFEDGDGQS